ncbi:SAV_915 family protein [Streptomyces sp. NPDC057616]|uniref:SAV_915 family protein n=1 Tax=Streptomyces sp. NPDC057616 TaxID=3346183 RepID=UPI0036D09F07
MTDILCGEDPEPAERTPAGPLFVPVRPGPSGCTARLFRTPLGERTAVAFTSVRHLTAILGPDQGWIRLAEPALRALTAPLGVTRLTLDPQFSAPAPAPDAPAPEPAPAREPAPVKKTAPAKVPAPALALRIG